MASYVTNNFKFGFASTSDKGVGLPLDPQVCWHYNREKRYVCDINNGYMKCNHNTLLTSENVIIVNKENKTIRTDNYRTIDSLLTELFLLFLQLIKDFFS